MDILLLSTTAQHATHNNNVILDAKSLKRWLNSLPDNNLQPAVKTLQTAIDDFNALKVEDKQRLKLLQIYYETLQELLIMWDEIRISMLPISAQQQNQLREDIMWLYLSLANGYKSIILSAFEKKLKPRRDPVLLYVIFVAMELIIDAMLYCYRSRQTPPPLARLEINQLFYYAHQHEVADIPIKALRGHVKLPTINRLFKQYVLLSITAPARLKHSEILELYLFLENIADNCIIESGAAIAAAQGKYIISADQDSSPQAFLSDTLQDKDAPNIVVDVWPIVNILAIRIADHDIQNQSFMELQERHLIEIVIEQLGRQSDDSVAAIETINQHAILVTGMPLTHEYLVHGEIPTSSTWLIYGKQQNQYIMQTKTAADISELSIGEIVCIVRQQQRQAAIIRSIQKQSEILEMRIEVLPENPQIIHYSGESEHGVEVDEHIIYPGLFFSDTHSNTHFICINKTHYRSGQSIFFKHAAKQYRTTPVALILDSPKYVLLKC